MAPSGAIGGSPLRYNIAMPDTPSIPLSVIVAAHPGILDALTEAAAISSFLEEHGLKSACATLEDASLRKRVTEGEFDLLVAVGGDGTMLRVSHFCAPCNVPILGINMGRLGFLMQFGREQWRSALDQLLKGEYWIENRMMLRAGHARLGESLGTWHALNEAVVCRTAAVRPVRLSASVDGMHLSNYVADGLIAATPTGSTAYALAAGGPILPPELRNILLVPIAPHLSVDRAVVLSEGTSVSITLRGGDAVLSVDGQNPVGLVEGDVVDVSAGEYAARFVRFGDRGYFYRNVTAHMNQNPLVGFPR